MLQSNDHCPLSHKPVGRSLFCKLPTQKTCAIASKKKGAFMAPSFNVIRLSLVFHYLKDLVFIIITHLYEIQTGRKAIE